MKKQKMSETSDLPKDPQEVKKNLIIDLLENIEKEVRAHSERYIMQGDIKFPIETNGIVFNLSKGVLQNLNPEDGSLVKIRPCGKEYKDETFLGIFVGSLPCPLMEPIYEYDKETKEFHIIHRNNPAIFVFKLNKIIWGCESFWSVIKGEEDIERVISDDDIANTWYVKTLKRMISCKKESSKTKKKSRNLRKGSRKKANKLGGTIIPVPPAMDGELDL